MIINAQYAVGRVVPLEVPKGRVRPAALRASRIEVGGACTLDAEGVMNRKRVKAEYGRGKRAGRAWAESGRSIAAVEAVVSYLDADEEPKDELLAAMLREVYADGPDDEFEAMRQMAQNSAYVVGWYDGVSELYREQMTGGARAGRLVKIRTPWRELGTSVKAAPQTSTAMLPATVGKSPFWP